MNEQENANLPDEPVTASDGTAPVLPAEKETAKPADTTPPPTENPWDGERLQALLAEAEAKGAAKARQEMANAKASPGALCGSAGESAPVFTREEVAGMTPAQVAEHFDRIRVSMRHWN